jgi:hypothetical protein
LAIRKLSCSLFILMPPSTFPEIIRLLQPCSPPPKHTNIFFNIHISSSFSRQVLAAYSIWISPRPVWNLLLNLFANSHKHTHV